MMSTRNVTRVYRTATPAQVIEGLNWYKVAYDFCLDLSTRYATTIEVVAGMVAATSPQQSWGSNKAIVRRAFETGSVTGTFTNACDKATRIMNGEAPLDVLGGDKVRAFYAGIISAGMTDVVCIDRHAMAVATNGNGDVKILSRKGVYDSVADCYVKAAKIVSKEAGTKVSPAQVQAITWVVWRNRKWSKGAFDGE